MIEFYNWLEQTHFSIWVRESGSIWAYPLVLTMHTCGMGILVGFNWAEICGSWESPAKFRFSRSIASSR
jgi:hypothetical protein